MGGEGARVGGVGEGGVVWCGEVLCLCVCVCMHSVCVCVVCGYLWVFRLGPSGAAVV